MIKSFKTVTHTSNKLFVSDVEYEAEIELWNIVQLSVALWKLGQRLSWVVVGHQVDRPPKWYAM